MMVELSIILQTELTIFKHEILDTAGNLH